MVAFTCNICGSYNEVEKFATEPATCACGSNVRLRALIQLLSMELFGQNLMLPDFPKLKAIRGLGMTDKPCYADILADKFDYTNTHYDREPRLDFTEHHADRQGLYDFILSSDVLEHIAPPIQRALDEVHWLLKPRGFAVITIYCNAVDRMREHFPELHEYRVVNLGDSAVLINRRQDGTLEICEDLIFHGGSGATLEMREFGMTALKSNLETSGFRNAYFLTDSIPEIGVLFDADVSQPLVARKEPFAMDTQAVSQLVDLWAHATEQIRLASQSKWIRLGRKLGVGPKLS